MLGAMAPPSKTSIMTGSGRRFDPYNPRVEDVHLPDIARGLRRGVASRFNGQLLDPADCPNPQSGIAHSYRVGRLCYWRGRREGFDLGELLSVTLAGMLHDAPEGYMGDTLGPIKTDEVKAVEAVVLSVIATRLVGDLGVYVCQGVHGSTVRWADAIALFQEALLYQPGAVDWAHPGTGAYETGELNVDRLGWGPHELARVQTRLDIADTLHLFHPGEGEDWAAAVEQIAAMLVEYHPGSSRAGEMFSDLERLMR